MPKTDTKLRERIWEAIYAGGDKWAGPVLHSDLSDLLARAARLEEAEKALRKIAENNAVMSSGLLKNIARDYFARFSTPSEEGGG